MTIVPEEAPAAWGENVITSCTHCLPPMVAGKLGWASWKSELLEAAAVIVALEFEAL